jgi:hypothetical protein
MKTLGAETFKTKAKNRSIEETLKTLAERMQEYKYARV